MKRCPGCAHARWYRLGDGRRKCRRCGRRYTWTSAWDSLRLPETVKRRLLRQFAIGVPAYRSRALAGPSLKAQERFNRLARAACAFAEGVRQAAVASEISVAGRRAAAHHAGAIEITLLARGGRVVVTPGTPREVPPRRLGRITVEGPLEFVTAGHAHMIWPVRGSRVVCALPPPPRAKAGPGHLLTAFAGFAVEWMRPFGAVRREFFHLYLGEVCRRFNRRGEPFETGLARLLRTNSIQSLRPFLVRKR